MERKNDFISVRIPENMRQTIRELAELEDRTIQMEVVHLLKIGLSRKAAYMRLAKSKKENPSG